MPVATTVVLLMQPAAGSVITLIGMYTNGSRMAVVQLCKHLFTVRIKPLLLCLTKQLLQRRGYADGTHTALLLMVSKGDTGNARLDCCRCR